MKQGLLVFLSLCALTTAMVPRVRRAMNTEEEEMHQGSTTTTIATSSAPTTCAYHTPCAWTVYKQNYPSLIEMYIPNAYCSCKTGTVCKVVENDTSVNTYIHHCRSPPVDDVEES